MPIHTDDTIAAVSTPAGIGGIAVVRVSGPRAFQIVSSHFQSSQPIQSAESHTAHHGKVLGPDGEVIDEAVATVFRSPRSYTGDDVVEISCHGGMYVTRKVLESIIGAGARLANPGEFTARAFLNGKLDLAQAEAVADLIQAKTDLSHRASIEQLEGTVSKEIRGLRDQLVQTLGLLELELDFVEEGLEFVDRATVKNQVQKALEETGRLIATHSAGKVIREGVRTALAGSPNVGKSSILNSLLRESRAIVTEVPGTTRDVIEEAVNIGGAAFVLADTAGMRDTTDLVEKEGVLRSEKRIQGCDLLLLIFDSSRSMTTDDLSLARRVLTELKPARAACILVLNKTDLGEKIEPDLKKAQFLSGFPKVRVSALTGHGMQSLREAMLAALNLTGGQLSEGGSIITSDRHFDALSKAAGAMELSLASLERKESNEFIVVDLRTALDKLGEITGVVTTEDILNDIFSKFCIGK